MTTHVTVRVPPEENAPVHVWRAHTNGSRAALGPVTVLHPGEQLTTMYVWHGTHLVISEDPPEID